MKQKEQQLEVALPVFEPAPQLTPVQRVMLHTMGPWDHCTVCFLKLIQLKYFSLPFTLFEPCGAVFIMNSKTHLRKNGLNEYFKTILPSLMGSMNTLVFIFAALTEVQVAVLSVF